MTARARLLLSFCGAALAVGCTQRVEPRRSPFITPLPEGRRQAIAAPEGSSTPSPAAPILPGGGAAMQALREMRDSGEAVRPASEGDGTTAAVDAARELVAADPRSLAARLTLARAYHHERIFDLALEHYLAARELAPRDRAIDRDLGRLWVDAGSPELALPYLDAALAADATDAESWSYQGIGLDLLGRYPEGEAALRRAIAVDPLRWDFFNNLGYNLLLQERYADAAAAFESGLVLTPGHAVLQNNLGLALGLAGRSDAALAAFRKGGTEAEAWNNLGVVRRALGELDGAAEAFERAARLDPLSRAIARNVRETRMRIVMAAPPATPAPDSAEALVAAGAEETPAEVVVSAPVSVADRRRAVTQPGNAAAEPPAPARPAPRVVPILPVDLSAADARRQPLAAVTPPPAPAAAPPAARAPAAPEEPVTARGYRLELLRTGFPDIALEAAADFRRRTGQEARVNQSGSTWMVQIGRDLTLAEARALRAAALRAGYHDARVRDAFGRGTAGAAPPAAQP